jgi:multidrug efflux pump subunit AcrA (membrane-fusion protein)
VGTIIMASTTDRSSERLRERKLAAGEAEQGPADDGPAAAAADQAVHPDHDAVKTPGSRAGASPPHPWRKRLLWAVGVVGFVVGCWWVAPIVITMLNTISTDDAYVNGHVTFVAPRVAGQVQKVFVDDNYRVKKGALLVQLDKEPYQVQLAIKQAAVGSAEADLAAAEAEVLGLEALGGAQRWQLQSAMERVASQIATLRANVATYESNKAHLELSRANLKRGEQLAPSGGISKEDLDVRKESVMAAANYWMALMNLEISPWFVIWPRVVMVIGLSMIFAPISVAAFKYTPEQLRGAAVGLFALLRNEGGSVGTSMAQTMIERRAQFHTSRVGDFVDPFNPAVRTFFRQSKAAFLQQTGDPVASQQMSLQVLADLREQQAASLSYFDDFWLFAVVPAALVFLVLFMKRSVAEKGAHIGAE